MTTSLIVISAEFTVYLIVNTKMNLFYFRKKIYIKMDLNLSSLFLPYRQLRVQRTRIANEIGVLARCGPHSKHHCEPSVVVTLSISICPLFNSILFSAHESWYDEPLFFFFLNISFRLFLPSPAHHRLQLSIKTT